ncbi:interleukin-17A-like isoform X2 [Pyxicephalus adspersus]|uniref:interleukin-17A-like isoform X2 n=1 Tax=Pyxicephalus adspersus TaxID=30357 RepID=UPI003B5A27CF
MPEKTSLLWASSEDQLSCQHQKKKCPGNRFVRFPSVIQVYVNVSQEVQWQVDDVNIRSLSPWMYSFDKNDKRYPSTITEAKCHGSCVDTKGNVDMNLKSVPIKQEILVLHREIKGCKASFKLKTMVVSVGCTCVRS